LSRKRKNAGEGYGYMFSGAFAKKADAVKKEKTRKGSFVKFAMTGQGPRYLVMTPRTNPRKKKAKKETQAEMLKRRLAEVGSFPPPKAPAKNPTELLVMGANPEPGNHEITVPPGSTLTIRMNPVSLKRENLYLGFGPAPPATKKERIAARKSFRASVREKVKENRAEHARLIRSARKAGAFRKKSKLNDLFHEVYGENPAPVCGASIGNYTCSRKPGHRGPHLPQGATLRPKSRIPHSWREKNPSAEALRESFTGTPVDRMTSYNEPHMPAGDYAQLGRLLALYVKPLSGGQVQQISFAGDARPLVLADESARQIYFAGGDQDVTSALSAFAARERGGLFELGEARRIDYKQRKEHVAHPELDEWKHNFGEENGERPTVWFDPQTKRLLLQGGDYRIRTEGIIN
jgi:hypothetical protein